MILHHIINYYILYKYNINSRSDYDIMIMNIKILEIEILTKENINC